VCVTTVNWLTGLFSDG